MPSAAVQTLCRFSMTASQPTILLPERFTRSSSLLAPSELGSAVSLLSCLGLGLGFELEPNPKPSPLALTLSAHPKRSP